MTRNIVPDWTPFLLFTTSLFTISLIYEPANAILEYPSVTQNLTQHLLESYDKNVRPVLAYSESVTVTHALLLKQIVRLDTKTQTLRLFMHEYTSWIDHYLTWEPEKFGNISVISLSRENIWIPDIIVFNQIGAIDNYYMRENTIPVKLNSNGRLLVDTPQRLNIFCLLQMGEFPFDVQECEILVGSYSQPVTSLQVANKKQPCIDLSYFTLNSEWSIVSVGCENQLVANSSSRHPLEKFAQVKYVLKLARRSAFYTRIIILPTVLVSFLSLLVFLLPYESGEKVGLAITVFVSQAFNILCISEFIPVNSIQLPVISQYCLFSIVTVWFSVLLSVGILSAHSSPVFFNNFTLKTQTQIYIFFRKMAPYLFVYCPKVEQVLVERPTELVEHLDLKRERILQLFLPNASQILNEFECRVFNSKVEAVEHELHSEIWHFILRCVDRFLALVFLLANLFALKLIAHHYV